MMNSLQDNVSGTADRDTLYAEYTRLQGRLDHYLQSSFEDFKLVGAIAIFLTWAPLANVLADLRPDLKKDQALILFLGFVGILLIIAVLGMRDLIKQSVIFYYVDEIQFYEAELRKMHYLERSDVFRGIEHLNLWYAQKHRRIYGLFTLCFLFGLLVLPPIVLWGSPFLWLYFIVMAVVLLLYGLSVYSLSKQVKYPRYSREHNGDTLNT
jgi:hypothetical protein